MIITCPSCDSRYTVNTGGIGPSGRKVKCTRCGHIWRHVPEPEATGKAAETSTEEEASSRSGLSDMAPPPPPPPLPDPPEEPVGEESTRETTVDEYVRKRRNARERRPKRVRFVLAAGWAAILVFVGGTIAGGLYFRDRVVQTWPATGALYMVMEEIFRPGGFEFQNISYEHQYENGLLVLAIRGEIINVANERKVVPRVRIGLRDAQKQEVYHWTFSVPESALDPNEVTQFVTRLSSPPENARDLVIHFVEEEPEDAAPVTAS